MHRTRMNIFAARILLSIILVASSALTVYSQDRLSGVWEGAIRIPGTTLSVTVTFSSTEDGKTTGKIDIPLQNARDLPLSGITLADDAVTFGITGVPGNPTFSGNVSSDGTSISGDFTQAGQTFPFSLTKKPSEEAAQAEAQLKAKLDQLRAFIDSTMGTWKTPGVAISIVQGDKVILSEGFGFRDAEKKLPVTDKTLFAIGSSSKAFTAAAVGLLVADGKLDWDTPVKEYLPDFELHNPYATTHMTPRDLLCHRSGLPRHDFMWYGSTTSRADLFHRLRYIEFSKDFRQTWQYQNMMFMTAGYLVGKVSGSSWEDVVRSRILDPLGMTHTNFSVTISQKADDFALPYGVEDDKVVRVPFKNIDEVGPAGSINSSVSEMINWVRIQLRDGKLGDNEVIPSSVIKEAHTPQMVIPGGRRTKEYFYSTYGLGWFIQPYRGHMRIHHGGSIDGFQALVSFLPDDDIGMVVLTNRGGSPMPTYASLYATDLLLDLEPVDWHGKALARREAAESEEDESNNEPDRVEDTDPSHDTEAYTGTFEHPAYGDIIVEGDDELTARFNDQVFDLEHWHYDVFRGTARSDEDMTFMFTFLTNTRGDVDRLEVPFEPAVEPIEFTRKASETLSDPSYLEKFEGEYDLRGTTITVLRSSPTVLTVTVPGQPTYTLEPFKENGFNLKGLKGYSVVFAVDDGVVTEIAFHQPNGVFKGPRKKAE